MTVSGHASTDLTLDKTTLTFTLTDWDTPQTVTVTAGQDNDATADRATLTHTAAGADYANRTADLTVTVTDDDTAALVLSQPRLTVLEGDAAGSSYTVKLATQPTGDVTVTVSGHASTDLTLDKTTLTFTLNNWNTPQTVTATAGQDTDATDDSATLTHTASGADYANRTADLTVTISDDDDAGVSVSEASLTIAEGGSDTYTIVLDSEPSADVTVTIIDPTDNTDVTADPVSLTFMPGNWNTAQTVTVSATHDADAEDETATVTHTLSSSDSNYGSAPADSVTVKVTDDAPAELTVAFGQAAYGLTEGDAVSVVVKLNADPERTVVIPLVASLEGGASDSDYSGMPERVTFNSGELSRSFRLTAADDNLSEPGERVEIVFGVLPTSPVRVTAGSPSETTVRINGKSGQDAPTAPTVHFAEATYSVAEGHSVMVTVELSKAAGSDVVIPLTVMEEGGARFADHSGVPVELNFAAADTERTFSIAALQDTADDDGESVLVGFSGLPGGITVTVGEASATRVSIVDDDDPQVTVQFESDTYQVAEGETQTVTVRLSADPERTVLIPITATNQGSASSGDYTVPTSVTFNATELEQTISFRAADDSIDDGGERVLLGFENLPSGVSAGSTATTTVSITDDDDAGVSVSEASLSFAEGGSDTYTIVLDSEPTADVTVTINDPTDNTDVTADPVSLTFSSTDWSTAQTVTVSAAQDADATGETATVTHTVSSSDSNYGSATADSVTVSVTDDDQAGVMVSDSALGVAEGGTNSYTIVLESEPSAAVTVTINDPTDNTDVTAEPADLTFSSTDWSTAQTVTVSAAQDADATGETATVTHTVSSSDSNYRQRHGRQRDRQRDR